MNYETTIDGMKLISSTEGIQPNDTILVEDSLYSFEEAIFKVKSVGENSVDLKLLKLQTIEVINDEEKDNFKANKLFTSNLGEAPLFHSEKLQVNQPIFINGKVFEVVNQEKKKGEPSVLELKEVEVKVVQNVYRVWRRQKATYELELFKTFHHWGTAFGEVMKMRSTNDDYFYHL